MNKKNTRHLQKETISEFKKRSWDKTQGVVTMVPPIAFESLQHGTNRSIGSWLLLFLTALCICNFLRAAWENQSFPVPSHLQSTIIIAPWHSWPHYFVDFSDTRLVSSWGTQVLGCTSYSIRLSLVVAELGWMEEMKEKERKSRFLEGALPHYKNSRNKRRIIRSIIIIFSQGVLELSEFQEIGMISLVRCQVSWMLLLEFLPLL